jgi:hypothetical protein
VYRSGPGGGALLEGWTTVYGMASRCLDLLYTETM